MAGDDRTGNSEIWKSIYSRTNEAKIKQKILQKSVLEEPDGSALTSADVIELDDVLLKGGPNEFSESYKSLVQNLYTPDQVAKDAKNMHSPEFFTEKMARLIRDICVADDSVLTPKTVTPDTEEQKDLKLSDIHNFATSIFSCKISRKAQSHMVRNPVSSEARALLMKLIDFHIARWVDENIASILEDALRSTNSGARDAQVKPRPLK